MLAVFNYFGYVSYECINFVTLEKIIIYRFTKHLNTFSEKQKRGYQEIVESNNLFFLISEKENRTLERKPKKTRRKS